MARGAGSGVKWYFQEEQDGNGKVRIHTKKGPLKLKEKEYGEVVNITTSKSDTMDEKLKVTFLHLSLTSYTNSLMELKPVLGPIPIGRPWLNSGEV